ENSDCEGLARILEALERSIFGPRCLDEAVPEPPDPLVVARLDAGLTRTDQTSEPRPFLDLDGMLGEDALDLAVPAVAKSLRQVLDQVAAPRDVEQLEAATDRECRQVAVEGRTEQRQLAGIAALLRRVGLGVGVRSVACGTDVGTPREHDPVERVER